MSRPHHLFPLYATGLAAAALLLGGCQAVPLQGPNWPPANDRHGQHLHQPASATQPQPDTGGGCFCAPRPQRSPAP